MNNPELVIDFLTTITKIINITKTAYDAYNELHSSNRRLSVRREEEGLNVTREEEGLNVTREEEGFYKTCIQHIMEKDEEHFFKATRMNVVSFNLLLTLLKERMERFSNRKATDPEKRLAVTLFFLAQGCNVHVVASTYKLAISTARKIIYETCVAIWDELHVVYLSSPNISDLKTIAEKFYIKTGMPNCLGAIDGKHVRITSPKSTGSLNYNYNKTSSVVLLATCDANYVFTYVDVGTLDSQSDSGILARSDFGRKLLNGSLEVPSDANLPGTTTYFPYYYVGNSAFPLKRNLMRPYPGHNLSPEKETFNAKLSSARVHIENSFGILANRWRVLHTTINASPKNVDKIVLATIVLHNFLMLQNDRNYFTLEHVDHSVGDQEIQGRWREETNPLEPYRPRPPNRSSTNSFLLRDTLKDYFSSNVM